MQPTETITVDSTTASCDGGGGALGHPKVYLSLAKTNHATCPYCSRHHVLRAGVKTGAGGH